MTYPILDILPQLRVALQSRRVVILQAPPGAGKSTVLPLYLLEEPWLSAKKIIMLEPRRLAAKSIAERMADQRSEKIGDTIGYRVRFDSRVGSKTKVEVVTEGILTRMIQADNSLDEAGLLIFDEFHERSLHADLALALSLQIQHVLREDLRILIMSATLDGEQLSATLGGAPLITSTGKQFPVDLKYDAQISDSPVATRMSVAIRKALRDEEGDILAFLPGAGEIRRTEELLNESSVDALIYPLYGDLPFKEQQEAILPRRDGTRKIVLATSIAETSLTIEGIRVVIDSGLARVPRFDPRSGLTRLETIKVTKDSADQRAGRAGRLGPGVCYRLWTEAVQRNLLPQRRPEIAEADLAPMMLELLQWGVKDVKDLTWMTVPSPGSVSQAKELLTELEAIDENGITTRGKGMLRLPTHPRISHMLLTARTPAEKALASDIAALIEERDPMEKESGTDLRLRIEALRKWRNGERVYADKNALDRVERLASNWRNLLKVPVHNEMPGDYDVGKFLLAAYPERVARQQQKLSEYYTLANGRVARLPPHDHLLHDPWLCIAQLDLGQKEGKIFMAAPLSERDLEHVAREQKSMRWDEERGIVVAALEKRVGGVLLNSKPVRDLNEEEKNRIIFEKIREKGLKLIGWGEEAESVQARIMSLKTWRPNDAWPDVSENALLNSQETWLAPYLTGIYKQSELEKLDCRTMLVSLLPWELQNRLDVLAPQRLEVPTGSMIKVQYFDDGAPPVMEVRLQEMFGLPETPTVNEGRVKILLHLLSPGYKPVQVTQDLSNFWHNTYHDVRKELRMRYPKHSWPEDPWSAEPVRGAKRRR